MSDNRGLTDGAFRTTTILYPSFEASLPSSVSLVCGLGTQGSLQAACSCANGIFQVPYLATSTMCTFKIQSNVVYPTLGQALGTMSSDAAYMRASQTAQILQTNQGLETELERDSGRLEWLEIWSLCANNFVSELKVVGEVVLHLLSLDKSATISMEFPRSHLYVIRSAVGKLYLLTCTQHVSAHLRSWSGSAAHFQVVWSCWSIHKVAAPVY